MPRHSDSVGGRVPAPAIVDSTARSRGESRGSAGSRATSGLAVSRACAALPPLVKRIRSKAPTLYCRELAHLAEKFTQILAIDGSRLDKIAHRLDLLWGEKAAILSGCFLATYDLRRRFATELWFDPDAASSEFNRARFAIECLDPNALIVGDRLYSSPKLLRSIFPCLALASIEIIKAEYCFELTKKANRGVKLRKPDWSLIPETVVSLEHIRVQRRVGERRKRDYDKARATGKSITAIEGSEELT
jgi:hypothetical protein